jgi:hypothetical protein
VAETGTTTSRSAISVNVTKISATIGGRTYNARITQAETTAYVEVWGDGWDYAENICTRDAKAAMVDATRLGSRHRFPAAQVNVLRMAAVVYTRQHAAS